MFFSLFLLFSFSLSLGILWKNFSPVLHQKKITSRRAFRQDPIDRRHGDYTLDFSFGNFTELSISFLLCLIYVFIGWIAVRVIHDERSYAFFSLRRGRDVRLILPEALTSLTALRFSFKNLFSPIFSGTISSLKKGLLIFWCTKQNLKLYLVRIRAYVNKHSRYSRAGRFQIDFRSKADLVALKPHYKAYEVLDMESVRQYYEIFNIDI